MFCLSLEYSPEATTDYHGESRSPDSVPSNCARPDNRWKDGHQMPGYVMT